MARTKITRRTYNIGNPRRTENNTAETGTLLAEEPAQDMSVSQAQDACSTVEAKAPEESAPALAAVTKTSQVPTTEPETSDLEVLSGSVCQTSPIIKCQGNAAIHVEETVIVNEATSKITLKPQESSIDKNDDCLELEWSTPGLEDASHSEVKPSSTLVGMDDSLSVSRDSPLNLAWDSSMKENCQLQANAPHFRPITPDNLIVPVDEILSPTTQTQIRTTIRALFPNGPPPPPPIKPVRRPKKGDVPYIVNCTKRPRVPSPKTLTVFKGDKYGITENSNCDEDEQCTPEKRARRGPNGSASISKSTFNRQSNEIAERLKLYEKIDRLVGRTPKEPVGYMTKRSFSPLPSTSTDNETIMKNDKHFSESLNCDNFDIDEDDDLPEVVLESRNYKTKEDRKCFTSPLVSKYIKKENNYADNALMEINEDMNNNNNDVISIDDDYCEIQFDKYMPKEKILDYSDVESKKEPEPKHYPILSPPQPSRLPCPTTSTDVICVENNVCTTNVLSPVLSQTSNSLTSPVLRASNKIPNTTETKQSNLVIEVPDVLEPLNMSRHASTRSPAWSGEVQFVSEVRTERSNNENRDISDVQIVSETLATSHSKQTELINELQQFLTCLTESYTRRKARNPPKKKNKKTKTKDNLGIPGNSNTAPLVNDENTAPVSSENAKQVNNENAAPSVNQVHTDNNSGDPSASCPSPGKRLGECPICLDSLPIGSIASTNCGHVFCLECIKQSLKTSGKRCPTCRKQLKGIGYHQVYL